MIVGNVGISNAESNKFVFLPSFFSYPVWITRILRKSVSKLSSCRYEVLVFSSVVEMFQLWKCLCGVGASLHSSQL